MSEEDPWDIKFDDLLITKTIGKGNFGKVYRGTYFGTDVAIKQLYYVDDEDMQKYIAREMQTLKGLRHPNIVQLLGLCKDPTGIFIVTEFIPGGDLKAKLKDKNMVLPWNLRVKVAIDLAYALNYLHSKKMIHRDLKSQNLLVCDDWKIKICDFGFARKAEGKADYLTMCGTDEWMAPEVGLGEKYDSRADVFSFGMILIELITRRKPPKRKPGRAYAFEETALLPRLPNPGPPPALYSLLLECAQFYPEKRPSMSEILSKLKLCAEQLTKEEGPIDTSNLVVGEAVYESSDTEEGEGDGEGEEGGGGGGGSGSEEEFVKSKSDSDNEEFSYGGVVVEVEDD